MVSSVGIEVDRVSSLSVIDLGISNCPVPLTVNWIGTNANWSVWMDTVMNALQRASGINPMFIAVLVCAKRSPVSYYACKNHKPAARTPIDLPNLLEAIWKTNWPAASPGRIPETQNQQVCRSIDGSFLSSSGIATVVRS